MAVLVEAISVVVRRDAIAERYPGGWRAFLEIVPNATICADDDLVRVGFMSPTDVESFIKRLEHGGLTFIQDKKAIDIAVVDQMRGPTTPAQWLEFSHLAFGDKEQRVAACWLFEGPRIAAGIHMSSKQMNLATPEGWRYEDSLSAKSTFVPNEQANERLKLLRHDDGQDVYLDLGTGKEVYVGRTRP